MKSKAAATATFICLYLGYGAAFWFLTGWGPGWLDFVGLSFRASFQTMPSKHETHSYGPAGSVSLGVFIVASFALALPLILTAIPTMATMLWINKRSTRKAKRDSADNGE